MRDHRGPRRRNRIAGQFSARTIEMMEAPAFMALSLAAHRILDRLEIEMAHHGGNDNGRLPVTFDHFVQYGIHRHSIVPGLREVCALGFVEITERGRAGAGAHRAGSGASAVLRSGARAWLWFRSDTPTGIPMRPHTNCRCWSAVTAVRLLGTRLWICCRSMSAICTIPRPRGTARW